MGIAVAVTLLSHIGLPIALITWLWFRRLASRLEAMARVLCALAFIAMLEVGGAGWTWVGMPLRWLFALAALAASGRLLLRSRGAPWVARGVLANAARGGDLAPRDLARYVIYDDAVYPPCDGEVLVAVDEWPDLPPPQRDAEHLAGNHVVIECGGVSVLLAHLRSGSVRVRAGARVSAELPIAAVGNTGNTSEPHLHIHAVRGRETDLDRIDETATPVAMTFDGRFLVRNDRVDGLQSRGR